MVLCLMLIVYVYRDLASYNASKHGVIGYTRSFQLMPYICNVRVNALCPFWVGKDHSMLCIVLAMY